MGPTTQLRKRFSANVKLKTTNSKVIYSALKPDIANSLERRATAHLKLEGDSIVLYISSEDLSHLRATINSYLRLAKTAVACLDASQ